MSSYFVTDAMEVDTPKDLFTPEGLEWYRIKTNLDEMIDFNEINTMQPLMTTMLCAVCEDFQNQCFYNGICNEFGACKCASKHAGALYKLDAGAHTECLDEVELPLSDGIKAGCIRPKCWNMIGSLNIFSSH